MKSVQDSLKEKKLSNDSNGYSNITKKFHNISLEDVDCQEQPINYSLKYPEESSSISNFISCKNFRKSQSPNLVQDNSDQNTDICPVSKNEHRLETSNTLYATTVTVNIDIPQKQLMYDSYTETDTDNFDQPIDYSRKYHEYGLDDCNQHMAFNTTSHHLNLLSKDSAKLSYSYEDTVKVFCTEDTPLNFSSASSLTDLRDVGLSGLQTPNSCFEENVDKNLLSMLITKEEKIAPDVFKNQYLSTVIEDKELLNETSLSPLSPKQPSVLEEVSKDDGEANINETPLMFSRSSSLCSLDSFEQHSIQDDQSSVSDFSQMTSGAISPSDLPDSPPCCAPKVSEIKIRPLAFFPTSSSVHSRNESIFQNGKLSNALNNDSICNANHLKIGQLMQGLLTESRSPQTYVEETNNSNSERKHTVQYSVAPCSPKTFEMENLSSDEALNTTVDSIIYEEDKQVIKQESFQTELEISASDKALLDKFIQIGMPKKKTKNLVKNTLVNNNSQSLQDINKPQNVTDKKNEQSKCKDSSVLRNLETSASDKAILDKYIHLGIPKVKNHTVSKDDIQSINTTSNNTITSICESSTCKTPDISESDRAILDKYILLGMPKNTSAKNMPKFCKTKPKKTSADCTLTDNNSNLPSEMTSIPVSSTSNDVLSVSDRDMLNKVIALGMPKNRSTKKLNSVAAVINTL